MESKLTPLHGPGFSSFGSREVTWLVRDVSSWRLERDMELREQDRILGRGHYSDDLPVESVPSTPFMDAFRDALPTLAVRAAACVQEVGRQLASQSRGELVLVSLIRAGVPAATWLRLLLERSFHQVVHHYAVSIIKDRGLDVDAMDYILDRHSPEDIWFIDGWTGSGAIRRELQHSLRASGLPQGLDRLAVLADPARAADIAGTSGDALLPSACLNSTSCGLVSRTVLVNGPDGRRTHGAKFYAEGMSSDMTAVIGAHVELALGDLSAAGIAFQSTGGAPFGGPGGSTEGRGVSKRLKLGLGETMRALQRRVPRCVWIDPEWEQSEEARLVSTLAAERKVPVAIRSVAPYGSVAELAPR